MHRYLRRSGLTAQPGADRPSGAFHPRNSSTFGEASISTAYLERLRGWEMLGCERLVDNAHQLVVAFQAR
jgi:hypothetical protein